jgi:hypothetical protein
VWGLRGGFKAPNYKFQVPNKSQTSNSNVQNGGRFLVDRLSRDHPLPQTRLWLVDSSKATTDIAVGNPYALHEPAVSVIEIWNLRFVWSLVLGTWNFFAS